MTVGSQEITTVVNIVNPSMFSISKMLRTPVLGKGRKVKHHYKAFRTVLLMMVEFNLARQVLGVKHKLLEPYGV